MSAPRKLAAILARLRSASGRYQRRAQRVAHALPAILLARVVAVALMLVGIIVAVRSGQTLAKT